MFEVYRGGRTEGTRNPLLCKVFPLSTAGQNCMITGGVDGERSADGGKRHECPRLALSRPEPVCAEPRRRDGAGGGQPTTTRRLLIAALTSATDGGRRTWARPVGTARNDGLGSVDAL